MVPVPRVAVWLALLLVAPAVGQELPAPDLGPAGDVLNDGASQVLPPALGALYNATGQNITREDVRIKVDLNVTKGTIDPLQAALGNMQAELQARIHCRVELRVISSDRIRAAIEGENAYNMSAENATWLSDVFIPAEVFRASASGEVIAAFQKDQEAALRDYFAATVPEMDLLALSIGWKNIHIYEALTDVSLTEPPIVVELDLVLQYVYSQEIGTILLDYIAGKREKEKEDESREEYIARMKKENGQAGRGQDFFAAAAYTQLLNLSMQPGWSLDIELRVPPGYSFTYANQNITSDGDRHIRLHTDAMTSDSEVQEVFLASITHKRGVALALFGAVWSVGLLLALPLRVWYAHHRSKE